MAKNATTVARVIESINKKYELMLVLKPDILESSVEKKLKEFEKFLNENGGTVDMRDNWGKKKLAYRIGKYSEGNYVVYNITLPTTSCHELDEHLRIDKDLIRNILVTLSNDYTYTVYKEEPKKEEPRKEEGDKRRPAGGHASASHKASGNETKSEVKDKGIKADAGQLDDKLDKLLEGDDLNI